MIALVFAAVLPCVVMAAAWYVHRRTQNAGWIDTFWTFGVGLAGAAAALAPIDTGAGAERRFVVAAIATIWSLRLGSHILNRTRTHDDDPRYARMRRDWGAAADRNFFWLLQIQAVCAMVLVFALAIAAHRPDPFPTIFDIVGASLFVLAWLGERAADRDLRAFRSSAERRNTVCDTGLWRFSRHPNYFFEWMVWVAVALIALDPNGQYPIGWVALAAPVLMYWLLVHVSGIPPLERHLLASRGDEFVRYRERTSAFFPWFPRHS